MNSGTRVLLIVAGNKYIESGTSTFLSLLENDSDFKNESLPNVDVLDWKDKAINASSFEMNDYIEITKQISNKYLDYDGFVVLDSIPTIAYTASYLSFMLENVAKPIVITGSHSNSLLSDTKPNLLHSLIVAGCTNIFEVIVCFNRKLFRGNRIHRIDASSFDPFMTYNYPLLGEFVAATGLKLTNNCMRDTVKKRFKGFTKLFNDIIVLHLIPQLTDSVLKALLFAQLSKRSSRKARKIRSTLDMSNTKNEPKLRRSTSVKSRAPSEKGVIISLFGVGNAPSRQSFKDILKTALNEYHCEIVIKCQSFKGGVDTSVYQSGNFLSDLNLITAGDMTTECCVAKLSYLMGKGLRGKQLKEQFETNIRGELTEMHEKKRRVVQHIPMAHLTLMTESMTVSASEYDDESTTIT